MQHTQQQNSENKNLTIVVNSEEHVTKCNTTVKLQKQRQTTAAANKKSTQIFCKEHVIILQYHPINCLFQHKKLIKQKHTFYHHTKSVKQNASLCITAKYHQKYWKNKSYELASSGTIGQTGLNQFITNHLPGWLDFQDDSVIIRLGIVALNGCSQELGGDERMKECFRLLCPTIASRNDA